MPPARLKRFYPERSPDIFAVTGPEPIDRAADVQRPLGRNVTWQSYGALHALGIERFRVLFGILTANVAGGTHPCVPIGKRSLDVFPNAHDVKRAHASFRRGFR